MLPQSAFDQLVDDYKRQYPNGYVPDAPPAAAPAPAPMAAPAAPPVQAAAGPTSLPAAPPSTKVPDLWDKAHRRDTLLAIGTGLLSGSSLWDGIGNAGKNLFGLDRELQAQRRKDVAFGGPDGAFEVITDPTTGEKTVREVPQFQDYLERKRTKAKDTADINGRAMYSLMQLPEDQRAQAYASIRANPTYYGVDPSTMPETYDPNYAAMTSGMGMTVSQALTRKRADESASALSDYRSQVQNDRERRTGIYADRSAATTRQGDARLSQGAQRIDISRTNAARRSAGGDSDKYEYRIGPNGQIQKRLKR
ncbi:hypothetical protein [Sphingomonas asaccharolytica]|uniref:hypothetical protein n=1 Tax=Sphingomonas asaccharolytica TaxID=40681 RepID=UPI0008350D24|nr:hypothetical protein [Sphingomonas asaccharolytica]